MTKIYNKRGEWVGLQINLKFRKGWARTFNGEKIFVLRIKH